MGDNLPFQSKCTALHKAAKKGEAEIVAALLGRVTNDPIRRRASVRYRAEPGGVRERRAPDPGVSDSVKEEEAASICFLADANIVDVSQSYI